MSNKNLTLDLNTRRDAYGKTFYVAKLEGPFLIDCSRGATFLVFVSDQGSEQLQIAPLNNKEDREDD